MEKYKDMSYKRPLILFWFLILGSLNTTIDAQELGLCDIDEMCYVEGEELVYKMYYKLSFLWIPAGEVTFRTKKSDDYFEYEAEGKTYSSYDPFFKVRDYFYSKVDRNTLKPIEFVRSMDEGGYRRYFETKFDYETNMAHSLKGKEKASATPVECSIEEYCIQDILSLMYHLRSVDLEGFSSGDQMNLDVFLDNKIYPINLKIGDRKKKLKVKNLGKFKAYQLLPETIEGDIFDDANRMKIWVSTDKNLVPLLIESPLKIGSIKAVLKSHKNLKYDLVEL